MRWEVGGHTDAVLRSIASRICFRQYVTFLCSYHLAFSLSYVSVHVVHPYSRTDTITFCFILSDRSDFHMIYNLSIAFYAFARLILQLSVNEMLPSRYVIWSNNFRNLLRRVEMTPRLKHINCFTRVQVEANAFCCLLKPNPYCNAEVN